MIHKTQAEANVIANLTHLGAPGPFSVVPVAGSEDRAYLFCGDGMEQWCASNLVEQGRFGRWIARRLHTAPFPGAKLLRVFRQDVPGKDRFAIQINVWSREVFECDHDGYGALHAPSVIGHVGMGIWHAVSRAKTDQRDVMRALRARGIDVREVSSAA